MFYPDRSVLFFRLDVRQLSDSPGTPLGNYFVLIPRQLLQQREEFPVSAIPNSYCSIAPYTRALSSPHRRAAKGPVEFLHTHLRQPLERRFHQLLARLQLNRLSRRRFAVPGADILADVAPENMPPHPGAKLVILRNRAPLLDREIRDALVGMELIRRDQRVSRAGIDATRATAAAIRRRQIRREIERGKNHAEEKPRAQLLIEDARVLADPSDAGILRHHALDDRAGVDVTASDEVVASTCTSQNRFDLPQTLHHRIVIVLPAPRVARDPPARLIGRLRGIRLRCVVVEGAHHNAASPGRGVSERRALQAPLLVARCHVLHLASVPLGNPPRKV